MTTETTAARYRVTGALVTVKTGALAGIIAAGRGTGYTVVTLYRGALLPVDAPPEDIERLLGKGFIEAVDDA